jgi:hypothetical protein
MMRQDISEKTLAMAAALESWAAARERAVATLGRHAAILAEHGCGADADHFSFAARALTVKAMRERAEAAALRTLSPELVM